MFLVLLPIRVFQKFHHNYQLDCRILADGTRIWHLECCNRLTSILGRRSQPNYPRHSLRTCLHHLLLDTHEPQLCQLPEDVLFGCFVIALNAAFTQQLSLADEGYESGSNTADLPTPLQETPSHTPHVQHGTCILKSGTYHTSEHNCHNEP